MCEILSIRKGNIIRAIYKRNEDKKNIFVLVKNLLFFSYTRKRCTILLDIDKASCIFISFYPLSCFGIKNL